MSASLLPRGRVALASAVVSLALTSGCSRLQVASAGELGCEPRAIEISEVERAWASESWRASCGDRIYQCSSMATAQAVDYSCRPFVGESVGEGEAEEDDESGSAEGADPGEEETDEAGEEPTEADLTGDDEAAGDGEGEAAKDEAEPVDEGVTEEEEPDDDAASDEGDE